MEPALRRLSAVSSTSLYTSQYVSLIILKFTCLLIVVSFTFSMTLKRDDELEFLVFLLER